MAKNMIPCSACGFMITMKEYKHNGGLCFECRDENEGYEGNLSIPSRDDIDEN